MANSDNIPAQDLGLIQVQFKTKQEQYAVPDTPLAVPVAITIAELNKLVNNLIEESQISEPKAIDFEFLIDDEILRTVLKEHLELKNISTENVLEIEYVERLPAPKPQDCFLHDDWVASVHTLGNLILSGCYDGSTHIWTDVGVSIVNVAGGNGATKSVCWAKQTENSATFLSAGQDQTAFLWEWTKNSNETTCLAAYRGHERSIESIDVSPDANLFASVGWDGYLKLWSLDLDPDEPKTKKSKTANTSLPSKTPEMTLKGHRDSVSCVRWHDRAEILTCSWDHTLRLWDPQDGGMKQEMAGNKAFLSCDFSNISRMILATSADKNVRLFDPRSQEGSVVKQTFTSHAAWVQDARWSPTDEHLFLSAGQDFMVKLWDTRSPRTCLYEMAGHTDKVLCCDWSEQKLLVSGGADNSVRVFTAPNKSTTV